MQHILYLLEISKADQSNTKSHVAKKTTSMCIRNQIMKKISRVNPDSRLQIIPVPINGRLAMFVPKAEKCCDTTPRVSLRHPACVPEIQPSLSPYGAALLSLVLCYEALDAGVHKVGQGIKRNGKFVT
ncbi:hypothetical protein QC760_005639 [Botrytis cinerea]